MVTIRKGTKSDAPLLARLNAAVQSMHYEQVPTFFKPPQADNPDLIALFVDRLNREDHIVYIAELDGQAVGHVVCVVQRRPDNPFTFAVNRLHIDEMSVDERYRRQGIGSALMNQVFELVRERDLSQVTLNVWQFNEQAIAFYRRHGFDAYSLNMSASLPNQTDD